MLSISYISLFLNSLHNQIFLYYLPFENLSEKIQNIVEIKFLFTQKSGRQEERYIENAPQDYRSSFHLHELVTSKSKDSENVDIQRGSNFHQLIPSTVKIALMEFMSHSVSQKSRWDEDSCGHILQVNFSWYPAQLIFQLLFYHVTIS